MNNSRTIKIVVKICLFISVSFLLEVSSAPVFAQSVTPLNIGAQSPDVVLKSILNSDLNEIKLSELKGKLVIIDFWATWCSVCVKSLPHLDSLQRQFGDEIVILPVTYEKREKVKMFLEKNILTKDLKLPFVTNDYQLRNFFPHRIIPHEVWIDKTGRIIAITDHLSLTAKNIQSALISKVAINQKLDVLNREMNLPLIAGGLGEGTTFDNNKLLYNSTFSAYIDGLNTSQTGFIVIGKNIKTICTNSSIQSMYRAAFFNRFGKLQREKNPNFYRLMKARTIIDPRLYSIYVGISQPNWRQLMSSMSSSDRLFNYETYVPLADSLNINKIMLNDLNRYFGNLYGIEGSLERQKVTCWALVKAGKTDQLFAKDSLTKGVLASNKSILSIRQKPLREFMWQLVFNHMTSLDIPIIDETGLEDKLVNLDVQADLSDPVSVNRALEKYGLTFKKVERELDMIVIRKRSGVID